MKHYKSFYHLPFQMHIGDALEVTMCSSVRGPLSAGFLRTSVTLYAHNGVFCNSAAAMHSKSLRMMLKFCRVFSNRRCGVLLCTHCRIFQNSNFLTFTNQDTSLLRRETLHVNLKMFFATWKVSEKKLRNGKGGSSLCNLFGYPLSNDFRHTVRCPRSWPGCVQEIISAINPLLAKQTPMYKRRSSAGVKIGKYNFSLQADFTQFHRNT